MRAQLTLAYWQCEFLGYDRFIHGTKAKASLLYFMRGYCEKATLAPFVDSEDILVKSKEQITLQRLNY